jgi:hypothetical protein
MDEDAAARAAQVELIRERQRSGQDAMLGTPGGPLGLGDSETDALRKRLGG